MDIEFYVISTTPCEVTSTTVHKGVTVPATIKGVEVGLTTPDHGTSLNLKFTHPVEIEEAKKKFVAGKTVTWKL